ncbi:GGDEF domain-containing protein [Persephonella sp.]|uniref:GGDEF domain-containing protein n=1 Tax=Persephonella sp. TaxID=2060922 RepID=UPI0026347F97|nr:GGDEF domain-containing protein [Persephonella sp.]
MAKNPLEYKEDFQTNQERIFYLFTIVGVFSTVTFAIINIYFGNITIGIIEIVLSSLAVLNAIYFKKTKNFEIAATNILILVFLVLMALIKTGGFKNHGIFWIYTFPLLTFFLKNKKIALLWNLIFIFSVFILLLLSIKGFTKIAYDFYTIFEAMSAYLAVTFLAYFYADTLRKLMEKLIDKAIYDPLTGLFNREFVIQYLKKEIEKIKRGQENSLCVIYIDLDNFKQINDKYGHVVGDDVLKGIAKIFLKNFRKSDVIGRIGGDEFLIVITSCKKDFIEDRLKLLRKTVENQFKEYNLSFSYGIILIPDDTLNSEDAIRLADQRMYKNKMRTS